MERGKFIAIDGIDASGKGVIEARLKEYESARGMETFDVVEFSQKNGRLPELSDFEKADIVFNSEPAYVGMGAIIRNEIIKKDTGRVYSPKDKIEAFSLDRLINMQQIVIPAMKKGIRVVQSRSLASTLAYQVIEARSEGYTDEETIKLILSYRASKLQLSNRPDLLIIPSITDPEEVIRRIEARKSDGKDDKSIFDNKEFQAKISVIYNSPRLRDIFTSRGTQVEYIDAMISKEHTQNKALEKYIQLLSK